jgi:hypothetical protein
MRLEYRGLQKDNQSSGELTCDPSGAKMRRTRIEHILSAYHPIATT